MRPVLHYMMGGVHTDIHGATPLTGLYAAGEAACVSINGANRLGSNSLAELLVFGARAGRAAAEYASQRSTPAAQPGAGARLPMRSGGSKREYLHKTGGTRDDRDAARGDAAYDGSTARGIYRDARVAGWKRPSKLARAAGAATRRSALDDHSRTFNTELIAALELGFMLDVAETIVHCALHREESRGAHQRTDFPERDDNKFLAHSLVLAPTPMGRRRIELSAGDDHPLAAGRRVYGSSLNRRRKVRVNGRHDHSGGGAVLARDRRRAALSRVSRSRCARTGWSSTRSTTSRTARRLAHVPLVVPDGHLRQLRHDGQRRTEADLRDPS